MDYRNWFIQIFYLFYVNCFLYALWDKKYTVFYPFDKTWINPEKKYRNFRQSHKLGGKIILVILASNYKICCGVLVIARTIQIKAYSIFVIHLLSLLFYNIRVKQSVQSYLNFFFF